MNTKAALLNHAETLARTKGFDAFSYADLSREIGIRKASIHYHFPSKADLAAELIARYSQRFFDQLDDLQTESASAAEQLLGYLSIYRNAQADCGQLCLCVAFGAGRDSFGPDVLVRLDRFHRQSIDWLTALFTRAKNDGTISGENTPDIDAKACLALVEGAQLIARASKDPSLFDAAVQSLTNRIPAKETPCD